MKIQVSLLATCLLLAVLGNAQVKFRDLTYGEALQAAQKENKIVFVFIESSEAHDFNEVALRGFANPAYADKLNQHAVSLRMQQNTPRFAGFDSILHTGPMIGQVFIDADGMLLSRYPGATTAAFLNIQQLDKALAKKANPDLVFKALQNSYDSGQRSFELLYQLVRKKNANEIEHDALVNEMLDMTPADSAASVSFIRFLAEQAPLVDSKASQYMRKNTALFNEAWYTIPLQKRVALNKRIIAASKAKAIKEKDRPYALKTASFTAATYSDRTEARKSYEKTMLDYYRAVKDTANFLGAANRYYTNYLMSISVDSLKKVDSFRLREAMDASPIKSLGEGLAQRGPVRFAPVTQYYAQELNAGAWTLYTFSKDALFTDKAVVWAKRALEFYKVPAIMDTYARLLYRKGDAEQAKQLEQEAIDLSKKMSLPSGEFEAVLGRMKNGKAGIDK